MCSCIWPHGFPHNNDHRSDMGWPHYKCQVLSHNYAHRNQIDICRTNKPMTSTLPLSHLINVLLHSVHRYLLRSIWSQSKIYDCLLYLITFLIEMKTNKDKWLRFLRTCALTYFVWRQWSLHQHVSCISPKIIGTSCKTHVTLTQTGLFWV